MVVGERFKVQLENGNPILYGFIKKGDETNLVWFQKEELKNYEVDYVNDIHKCIVPIIKKKK